MLELGTINGKMGLGWSGTPDPKDSVYPPPQVDARLGKKILKDLQELKQKYSHLFEGNTSEYSVLPLLESYIEARTALKETIVPQVKLLLSYPRVSPLCKSFVVAEVQVASSILQQGEDSLRDSFDTSGAPSFDRLYPRI